MLLALLAGLAQAATPSQVCPDRVTTVAAAELCPLHLFFDSGETEIRREWEPVVQRAAELARNGSRLLITGHSDTPGSAAVNRRMGLARASIVARALAERGVPAATMTVSSAGEEQLLVPTAEGVREIQNRRVTIRVVTS